MTQHADFVFYTHATPQTGFGHAARCAQLAKIISRRMPGCNIGFFGEFDDVIKNSISMIFDPIYLERPSGLIGIYDRMDSPEDPFFYCEKKLRHLISHCERVVFMANSPNLPNLPESVTTIGYKIGGQIPSKGNVFWGTEFVPVNFSSSTISCNAFQKGKVLVALGGAQGMLYTELVIEALNSIDCVQQIDILISPVNDIERGKILKISKKPIEFVSNVPDISQTILAAEIILASYGHLGYEAMCLGKPVCLVGQKQFQFEYAERLAKQGYCISAGWLNDIKLTGLIQAIENTFWRKTELMMNVKKDFDGQGLERTAMIITNSLELHGL